MTTDLERSADEGPGAHVDDNPKAYSPTELRRGIVMLAVCVAGLALVGLLSNELTASSRKTQAPAKATAVVVPGASDAFERSDNLTTLGDADSGQPWHAIAGRWGVVAHLAAVTTAAPGAALATVPVGSGDGRVDVVIARMAPGAGLAFRCRGALNCWRVEAVPQLGTWNVVKEVKGQETRVANLGVVPVASGTKISVVLRGDQLTFLVNDRAARTIHDSDLALNAGAGLSLRDPAGAQTARWARFKMTPYIAPGLLRFDQAAIHDAFDRPDAAALGRTPTGQQWQAVSGGWSIDHDLAASSEPAVGAATVALIHTGSPDGTVEATLLAPQNRSGIAFRCLNSDNCWRIEVIVEFGTWNIYKVVNGDAKGQGNVGVVPTAAGTTVSVRMSGSRLTFFVDGVQRKVIDDATYATADQVGLVVEPAQFSNAARWSQFLFQPS